MAESHKRKKKYDKNTWARKSPVPGVISYACRRVHDCRACTRLTCSHECHTVKEEGK
jgi:hypothetical protein